MLKKLTIKNFRNYASADIEFSDGINLFVGENGQGKTNLLEAVYFLTILRSFRSRRIQDIKRIGSAGFLLAGNILTEYGWDRYLEIEYRSSQRILRLDGKKLYKATDFIGNLDVVAFVPSDILIVTGSAGLRRRFFDIFLSLLYPEYLVALTDYTAVIQNRNILLKQHTNDRVLLDAYDISLASAAEKISKYRKDICLELTKRINDLFANIKHNIQSEIIHKTIIDIYDKEKFIKLLHNERKKDFIRGFTTVGPHTDEFDFICNGKLLKSYGSTGQCRIFALCLKLAQFILIKEKKKQRKILALIDDVTGDLDNHVKEIFFNILLPAGQMFFAFCDTSIHENVEYFKDAAYFTVNSGTVTRK